MWVRVTVEVEALVEVEQAEGRQSPRYISLMSTGLAGNSESSDHFPITFRYIRYDITNSQKGIYEEMPPIYCAQMPARTTPSQEYLRRVQYS